MPHSYASSLARLYRLGPMTALAATPPSASTPATAIITRIGTYGLFIGGLPCGDRTCVGSLSCCGYQSAQTGDDPVHHVAAVRLVAVREQLVREAHQQRPTKTVPGAQPHDLRVLDQLH